MRTEEEVDAMIDEMASRVKGNYITQAVAFNKTCPRQMGLLKKALMSSISFSGLVKELLVSGEIEQVQNSVPSYTPKEVSIPKAKVPVAPVPVAVMDAPSKAFDAPKPAENKPRNKNIGNFF